MLSVVPGEVLPPLFESYREEKTAGKRMPTEVHILKNFNLSLEDQKYFIQNRLLVPVF